MTATDVQLGLPPDDVKKPDDADARLWSVTTIIGCLDKPALLYWTADETARAAIRTDRTWKAMLDEQGEEETISWLSGARFRGNKDQLTSAQLGTVVHSCCEQYALTGQRPQDNEIASFIRQENNTLTKGGIERETVVVNQMLDQFDRWLQLWQPSYQAAEVTVYSPTYGYAGTCDGFLTIDGVPLIVDYKTSRKSYDKNGKPTGPYPEAALQLAGYRYAEMAAVWRPRRYEKYRRRYYLLSPEEQAAAVPVPDVEGGVIIHITPEHCEAYPVRCDKEVHERFLFVQEAARWHYEMSKDAIGLPMVKGERKL
jgi:hypothetical protein